MRVCSKCGASNADEAKFCTKCSLSLQQPDGKTCPSGRHTMDPTWSECVYCRTEARQNAPAPPPVPASMPVPPPVRSRTVFEGSTSDAASLPPRPAVYPATFREDGPLPPRPMPQPFAKPPSPPAGLHTPIKPQRDPTVYRPGPGPSGPPSAPPVTSARKIVGILVSYSWHPEGKIYPVREGRNLIGRDTECDICVPEDETMSGQNSSIQYRANFIVRDKDSMSGTDVDGVPVEEQCAVTNYSTIRAGSTYFTFLAIQRPGGPATGPERSQTA